MIKRFLQFNFIFFYINLNFIFSGLEEHLTESEEQKVELESEKGKS